MDCYNTYIGNGDKMKKGRLILTSCGLIDLCNNQYTKMIYKNIYGKKVLFVDNATLTGSNTQNKPVILRNFENFNANVTVLTLSDQNFKEISNYDVVYFTGGDVAPLLELAQSFDLKTALISYIKDGGVVIGESAGSMFLARDVKWCYEVKKGTKPKYDVVLDSYKGVGLTDLNIYPHWNKVDEAQRIKAELYEIDNNIRLIRLEDGQWLEIEF